MPEPTVPTRNEYQQIRLSYEENYESLWAQYRIRLIKGAYDTLQSYPPNKEYVTNSSSLESGVRYDIPNDSSYVAPFDEKTFTIHCLIDASGDTNPDSTAETKFSNFITKYHGNKFFLKIYPLQKTFRLVYKSSERVRKYLKGRIIFALKVTEYDPSNRTYI